MANTTNSSNKITTIQIRMYRPGTGDFFILLLKKRDVVSFKMMVDCGCINAGKKDFISKVNDLGTLTDKNIDLLIITHQHADHINGFEKCADLFDKFTFKKVWFAWTEDDKDPIANDYRTYHSELSIGLNKVVKQLNRLVKENYYDSLYSKEVGGELMLEGKKHFIDSLTSLDSLNPVKGLSVGQPLPTMVELFKDYKVIKENTKVEYLEPGDVRCDLKGAEGIRFYILGPPRKSDYLNKTKAKGEMYEQREEESTIDFSFLSALGVSNTYESSAKLPFELEFEDTSESNDIRKAYHEGGDWRKIDFDWLYSAGKLAMRYERSVNNTSLAFAIQFEDSERVLLFTGDAEYGNWESWHKDLEWPVKINGQIVKKKVDYLLNKTVFYKVGHHLSQNGTAKGKGIEMMTSEDLSAMVTLDFKKINKGWLSTMPNDLLGAELIRKTKGKLLFAGDYKEIIKNIKTNRVIIKREYEKVINILNTKFSGKDFIDCEIK
ncbi:MAG: hypothetical protein JXB49_16390 [Bacteroidales bacterium]|nr:hypothetical protein [Bacteroidales bacterium]